MPSIIQALPFIAVVQPPNLIDDSDSLPAYIRADIVVKLLKAEAKVIGGPKRNQYYDSADSARLRNEAEFELNRMAMTDEDLYRQNLLYPMEQIPEAPLPGMDSSWAINHGVSAGVAAWW